MDSVEAFSHVAGKLWLAYIIKALLVMDGAGLVELSEKDIEVNDRSGVNHEIVPVGALAHDLVFCLELLDDLWEVPWESKNISVLLLAEDEIGSHSLA